jgi:membrane protein DedA with SNARE-associated domain
MTIVSSLRESALTGLALVALLSVTSALAVGAKTAVQLVGLGGLASGASGRLLFVVTFSLGFAVVFAGFVLWYWLGPTLKRSPPFFEW